MDEDTTTKPDEDTPPGTGENNDSSEETQQQDVDWKAKAREWESRATRSILSSPRPGLWDNALLLSPSRIAHTRTGANRQST
jgi:hypothetical protein